MRTFNKKIVISPTQAHIGFYQSNIFMPIQRAGEKRKRQKFVLLNKIFFEKIKEYENEIIITKFKVEEKEKCVVLTPLVWKPVRFKISIIENNLLLFSNSQPLKTFSFKPSGKYSSSYEISRSEFNQFLQRENILSNCSTLLMNLIESCFFKINQKPNAAINLSAENI